MLARKLFALSLAMLFLLGVCTTAFAAPANPDAPFMNDLKKLEAYLRANSDDADLGNKAARYIRKSLPTMDVARLSRCLRTFLRCAETVPLEAMLKAYAGEIKGYYYMSIHDYAVEYNTSPDVAADQNFFARGYLGSQIGGLVTGEKTEEDEEPCKYCPPPCCVCCR